MKFHSNKPHILREISQIHDRLWSYLRRECRADVGVRNSLPALPCSLDIVVQFLVVLGVYYVGITDRQCPNY